MASPFSSGRRRRSHGPERNPVPTPDHSTFGIAPRLHTSEQGQLHGLCMTFAPQSDVHDIDRTLRGPGAYDVEAAGSQWVKRSFNTKLQRSRADDSWLASTSVRLPLSSPLHPRYRSRARRKRASPTAALERSATVAAFSAPRRRHKQTTPHPPSTVHDQPPTTAAVSVSVRGPALSRSALSRSTATAASPPSSAPAVDAAAIAAAATSSPEAAATPHQTSRARTSRPQSLSASESQTSRATRRQPRETRAAPGGPSHAPPDQKQQPSRSKPKTVTVVLRAGSSNAIEEARAKKRADQVECTSQEESGEASRFPATTHPVSQFGGSVRLSSQERRKAELEAAERGVRERATQAIERMRQDSLTRSQADSDALNSGETARRTKLDKLEREHPPPEPSQTIEAPGPSFASRVDPSFAASAAATDEDELEVAQQQESVKNKEEDHSTADMQEDAKVEELETPPPPPPPQQQEDQPDVQDPPSAVNAPSPPTTPLPPLPPSTSTTPFTPASAVSSSARALPLPPSTPASTHSTPAAPPTSAGLSLEERLRIALSDAEAVTTTQ